MKPDKLLIHDLFQKERRYTVPLGTLSDKIEDGDRLQVFGSVRFVRAEIYRTGIEQVRPTVSLPVERIIASYRLRADGWHSEGFYND
jgi:hypothetical protein